MAKASDAELWFFLIRACTNCWANDLDSGDLRLRRAQYDVTVMIISKKSLAKAVHVWIIPSQTYTWMYHL